MVIARSPFRISFFGGSSDYEDFYSKHGSFIIGTTIDKYSYASSRFRPNILRSENIVSYSEVERFTDVNQLKNPLLREIFKKFDFPKNIDVHLFADIPSRTGLGGSSACCCSMLLGLSHLNKDPFKLIHVKFSLGEQLGPVLLLRLLLLLLLILLLFRLLLLLLFLLLSSLLSLLTFSFSSFRHHANLPIALILP